MSPIPLHYDMPPAPIVIPEPIPEPPDRTQELLDALRSLTPQVPVPVIVEPPDLSDIVTAVTSLKPGPTAAEIAAAIADVLLPGREDDGAPALREVAEALRNLDFRMQGFGRQAYGGGAVHIEPGQTIGLNAIPPIVVDPHNSTTTPLAANATFTGTATDISGYQQINIEIYGRPSTIQGDASNSKATFFFEFSPDGTNWDVSVPSLIRDPGLVIPVPIINVGRWFRVRYLNDGGALAISIFGLSDAVGTPTDMTTFRLNTQLLPLATKELTRTLDQSISGSDPVGLTRSVATGSNPDGTYVNAAAGGTKTLSPATTVLGANAVYTSGWMDTENYPTIKLLVAADQVSADNGVVFQWSDTATGVVVRTTETHTFRSGYIANGFLITATTRARYLRIVYTNGTAAQGRFFLNLRLNPVPVIADVNLIPSVSGNTGQQTVTTTATALSGIGLAGRDSFRLKNLSTSARPLFYGFSGSLTSTNGDELAAGESVELDIDETVSVYVITTSTSGAGVQCSFCEIA